MGKGDRKTAKGKRYNSSYGNARLHVLPTKAVVATDATAKKTVVKAVKKAVAKKAVVKAD